MLPLFSDRNKTIFPTSVTLGRRVVGVGKYGWEVEELPRPDGRVRVVAPLLCRLVAHVVS